MYTFDVAIFLADVAVLFSEKSNSDLKNEDASLFLHK